MAATLSPATSATRQATGASTRRQPLLWVGFVVASLLALDVLDQTVWAIAVPVTAGALWMGSTRRWRSPFTGRPGALDGGRPCRDRRAVPGGGRAVAAGLHGVHRRPLRSLGLGLHRLGPTLALGLLFAGVQAAVMLWGYQLPAPVDWVPLLMLSLAVGLFEAVFFRGFVQGRLEASFGTAPAVAGAAALYALYHVGYGMGVGELGFLFALGVVYAVAYRLTSNVLVLWPLLTPLGGWFNNLEAGDIDLPWASVAGFADVLGLMALAIWLAHRHRRAPAQGGNR